MIEIKMNEGEFELKALADKSQFLAEAVLVVKELTGAYAQHRSISFDEAFEEIREKINEVLDREDGCEEGTTRHGKWIPWDTDTRGCTLRFACSVCGNYTTYYEDAHECDYDYCPNCGAKMDLKK